MIDHDTWFLWLRRGAAGLGIGIVLLTVVYVFTIMPVVRANTEELSRVTSELTALRSAHETTMRDATARLDAIERVLFGDIVTKIEQAPPSRRMELWQENRDKELRERIQRLEQWRAEWGH